MIRSNNIRSLYKYLKRKKIKSLVVFTGDRSFKNSGIKIPDHIQTIFFKNIKRNPTEKDIIKLPIFPNCDAYLAIGGGSVIDFAKLYITMVSWRPRFLIVTTTAGSGSEATGFASLYHDKKKTSVKIDIRPDLIISDPAIVDTMPAEIRAASYLDAFIHAIESQWSKRATWISKYYSKKAVKLLLDDRYIDGAYYAGKAINIAHTNIIHAISYYLMFAYDLLHGFAVGIAFILLFPYHPYAKKIKSILDSCDVQIPDLPLREVLKYANKERLDNYDWGHSL